ncbi:MAG: FecR domain-containing protein [Gemmatimonadetes bacterium]|nr:FecR domain-containing protein [Gemmatimonadota bacterium]
MDDLLLRYLRKQTTEEETASVDVWLNSSPGNERALADLRRMVQVGRAADRMVEPGNPPRAEEVIWRAEARATHSPASTRAGSVTRIRPVRPRLRLMGGLAAAAVVLLMGVGLWNAFGDSGRTGAATAELQEFMTGPGQTEMVRLGDGSIIRLGPDSRLSTTGGGAAREVTLQGEAFFAVATDEARPFRIVTAAGTARVLGTRFHLAAGPDKLAVTVVEGRVALAGPDHEVQVGAGQATSLLRGQPESVEAAPPLEAVAAWLDDFLVFHDTPLRVAMNEVEQRYGVRVEVDDPALQEQTLTMWFSSKSLDEVMTVVCGVVDARCSIGEQVVTIQSHDTGDGR